MMNQSLKNPLDMKPKGLTHSLALLLALSALAALCASAATPPGLVGWWRAEGNANDSAGANQGIAEGGLAYTPGEVGLAFSFNGADADVRIPASDALDVGEGSGMSVEAWIKPADVAGRHPFFEWNDGAFGTTIGFSGSLPEGGAGPGAFVANFKDLGYQGHVINSSPGVLTADRFQHVAATYDRGSGVATLYVDGAIVARADLGIFTPRTIGDLYLGLRPYDAGAGLRYAGLMDEVSVYNRALSAGEVQAIYKAGEAGKGAVPIPPFIVAQPWAPAIQPSEPPGLPAGILEEDLNLDLNAAIQSYQSLINQFDAQRPMAANAVFRMAECYRRLGRMDEARSQYVRILREFADQAPLVKLSRKYANPALATGQMPADGVSPGPHPADETATRERQLLRDALIKAKREIAELRTGLLLGYGREAPSSQEVAGPEARLKGQVQSGRGKVYVSGQVGQSGPLEIPDGEVITVSQAILKAGGFSDFADKRHVRLIRGGRQGQDSTNRQTMIINVAEIWEKGEIGNDIPVQADDVIYVPKLSVIF